MTELLPQPHGLDRQARVVGEGLEARQLPASDLEEPSRRCIEGYPAPPTAQTDPPHQRRTASAPMLRTAQHRRNDLRARMNLVVERLALAGVPAMKPALDDLDVLLRHRTPSYPATRSQASGVGMPTRLGSLVDHRAHLVTRERPHRLRADVPLGADGQERRGSSLVVRSLEHRDDVVLSEGPIDIDESDAKRLELLLCGFVAIDGALKFVTPCWVQSISDTYLGIPPSPLAAILLLCMSLGHRSDGFQAWPNRRALPTRKGEGHDRRGANRGDRRVGPREEISNSQWDDG